MVAFISHDLRNPLESISAATAILQLVPQTAENEENIESIARASTEMQRLVQDLLDVSTIEAGRMFVHRTEVDLRQLILELHTIVSPQVKARGARIETRLVPGLPTVSIDRHRILQVLLNLIGNALKFGEPGVVVTLGAERQDKVIRIWVQDTGDGISDEEVSRVFDRFWRSDRRAGTGLGLALAKGIVEAAPSSSRCRCTPQLSHPLETDLRIGSACYNSQAAACVCYWWTTTTTSCSRW
jgi:signal transduction histidine kinase